MPRKSPVRMMKTCTATNVLFGISCEALRKLPLVLNQRGMSKPSLSESCPPFSKEPPKSSPDSAQTPSSGTPEGRAENPHPRAHTALRTMKGKALTHAERHVTLARALISARDHFLNACSCCLTPGFTFLSLGRTVFVQVTPIRNVKPVLGTAS